VRVLSVDYTPTHVSNAHDWIRWLKSLRIFVEWFLRWHFNSPSDPGNNYLHELRKIILSGSRFRHFYIKLCACCVDLLFNHPLTMLNDVFRFTKRRRRCHKTELRLFRSMLWRIPDNIQHFA